MADNDQIHIDETRASGGRKSGRVIWITVLGTGLAIVLLGIVWMTGALTQGDREEDVTASANMADQVDDGAGTDSIIGDGSDANEGTGASDTQMQNGLEVNRNDPTTVQQQMREEQSE